MTRIYIIRLFGLLLIFLVCFSCGNEIHLFPDEVPSAYMVYGIMDANSADQYVKIRKTFGGNTGLEEMTGNSDLFNPPDSMKVKIDEYTGENIVVHPLIRNLLAKDPGIFSDDENVIYQGNFQTEAKRRYEMIIENPESGEIIRASTVAIAPPRLRFPSVGNTKYRFADTVNHFYVKYEPSGSVHFQQFFINYAELLNSGDTLFKTVCYNLTPKFKEPQRPVVTYTRTYSKDYVLNIMRMLIPKDANVRERQLHSFDFMVWAGDENLRNYIQLSGKYNDNRRQFFSNIEGGLGVFASSSHSGVEGIWPLQAFFDTIARSSRLENLSFSNKRFSGDFQKAQKALSFFVTNGQSAGEDEIMEEW